MRRPMTSRRRILIALFPLLLLPLFLGAGVGTIELSIWLVLLLTWVALFVRWGRHD